MIRCQFLFYLICYNSSAMSLGKNIEKYRKKAGLSREKLVLKCGGKFSASHLVRIEKETVNNPGIEIIKTITNKLGLSIDQLVKD